MFLFIIFVVGSVVSLIEAQKYDHAMKMKKVGIAEAALLDAVQATSTPEEL